MIFGMGPAELVVILVVVLIVFGPKNLPRLGSMLGKTVRNIRAGMEDDDDPEIERGEVKVEAASDEKVAVCPKCGYPAPETDLYCPKCGARLDPKAEGGEVDG